MPTILLLQEDATLRSLWSSTLESYGYSILVAPTVADAVDRAREGGIDAVVLDALDPGRIARELLGKLQRLPEPPPLILVSSSSKAPELSARLGAATFVPKPCTPDELVHAVGAVVNTYVRTPSTDHLARRIKRDW